MADPQDVILTLLSNSWVSANTNNIKPTFTKMYAADRIANVQRNFSIVLSQEIAHPVRESALGGYDREDPTVSLQIITDRESIGPRAHALKLRDEAIRILRLNARNGVSPYIYFQIIKMQDVSDALTQVQKHVIDVRITSHFNYYG